MVIHIIRGSELHRRMEEAGRNVTVPAFRPHTMIFNVAFRRD